MFDINQKEWDPYGFLGNICADRCDIQRWGLGGEIHWVMTSIIVSIVDARIVLTMLGAGRIVFLILQRFLRTYACRPRDHHALFKGAII